MDWEKGCSWGEKAPLHAHLPEKGGTLNLTFQAGGVQSLSCYRWCGCMKTPPQASVPFFLTSRLWVCLLHWQQLQEAILCHQVSMVQSHSDT